MKLRFFCVCAAAPVAALVGFAAPAQADAPAFPISTPVPVSLPAAGTSAYALSVGSGGSLSVQLQSGDLSVLLVDDHSNTTRDNMAGSATSSIGLQPSSTSGTFQVDLSSQNGAQAVLQFTPGASGGTVSSAGPGGVVSISSSGGSSVSISGNGSVVSSGNGSVVINGNGVSITDGAGSISVGDGGVSIVSGNGATVVSSGSGSPGNAAADRWAGRGWWFDGRSSAYRRDW